MSENSKAWDTSLDQAANIVAAFVSNNAVQAADLPDLIAAVHSSLRQIALGQLAAPAVAPETPAVPIKKSVTRDHIICLEDGKKFKSLRRHLNTHHNMTPEQYRSKWGLPSDHPMVAPSYSEKRSQLARDAGLGLVGKEATDAPPAGIRGTTGQGAGAKKQGRGRPRKAALS